jgi:hypothetical protein
MTKKRFTKLITAVWHIWNIKTNGSNKEDLPLKVFLERHLRRAKKKGYKTELHEVSMRFLKRNLCEREKIIKILDLHNIPHYEKNGRIYADSMEGGTKRFEYVVDTTYMTPYELLLWLGY